MSTPVLARTFFALTLLATSSIAYSQTTTFDRQVKNLSAGLKKCPAEYKGKVARAELFDQFAFNDYMKKNSGPPIARAGDWFLFIEGERQDGKSRSVSAKLQQRPSAEQVRALVGKPMCVVDDMN